MNRRKYLAPEFEKSAFNCPSCDAYAMQKWKNIYYGFPSTRINLDRLKAPICSHCRNFSLWIDGKLLYPAIITAPLAHTDMPESVSEYYTALEFPPVKRRRVQASFAGAPVVSIAFLQFLRKQESSGDETGKRVSDRTCRTGCLLPQAWRGQVLGPFD